MAGDLQLDITPDELKQNAFRTNLQDGKFTVLIEASVPEKTVSIDAAESMLSDLENAVVNNRNGINAGLALLDHPNRNTIRSLEYASGALSPRYRNNHVVYLSGRDCDPESFSALLRFAKQANIKNIIPVSGEGAPYLSLRECRKKRFLESVTALDLIKRQNESANGGEFFAGTVVNPYQYRFYTLISQYCKLVKKFGQGAEFAVAQMGWDMLKLQSLLWYLDNRGLFFPVIARIGLLSPEKVENINSGKCPGISLSKDFNRILNRELRYSKNQFEAAQYRRIELQIAGCRLMGASGVQISGADTPAKAKFVVDRASTALREFNSFEQWLEEYNAYMANVDMSPVANNFNLYDRFLYRNYPVNEVPQQCECAVESPELLTSLRHSLRKMLFANPGKGGKLHNLLKMVTTGCCNCGKCRLPDTEYVCPERCPKRLADGPCGGVRPDGSCELNPGSECTHIKITRLAYQYDEYIDLDKKIIGQVNDR